MNEELRATLEAVRSGALSVDEAALRLKKAPFEDLGYAKVDLHRAVRQGAAEVIYGAGKTPAQIAGIAARMRERGVEPILITRLSPEAAAEVEQAVPLDYRAEAKLGIVGKIPEPAGSGTVVVATGGTSDIPVAEEAAVIAAEEADRRFGVIKILILRAKIAQIVADKARVRQEHIARDCILRNGFARGCVPQRVLRSQRGVQQRQ